MALDILKSKQLDPLDEQARRAVSVFRSLQPTLTAYAQAMTGRKDLRVVMAARDNGSTDGKSIFFRPPLELGDVRPHERRLCDKRNPDTGKVLCHACAVREKVLTTIFHEIGHNAFESFEKTTPAAKKRAIEWAVREARGEYKQRIEERIRSAPEWKTRDYLNLATLINEFLPTIVGVMEDARVDTSLFRAKPGLKRMFEVDNAEIFNEGFEGIDQDGKPVTHHWKEAPLNHQVMLGLYCKTLGYNYSTWFHSDVVQALDDPELGALVSKMETVNSAGGVYNLSFQLLQRLRELGFCATPDDPDPEPEEDDENDSQDDSEDEADESSESGESDSGEPGQGDNSEQSKESKDSEDPSHEDSDSTGSTVPEQEEPTEDDETTEEPSDKGEVDADSSGESEEGPSGSSRAGGSPTDNGDQGDGSPDGQDEDEAGLPENDPALSGESRESEESNESGDSDDIEPIDTGADDGYGGTRIDKEPEPRPEMGTPDGLEQLIKAFGQHDEKPKSLNVADEERAVDKAIVQGIYFTTPSKRVNGVREHFWGKPLMIDGRNTSKGWQNSGSRITNIRHGIEGDFTVPDSVISPSVIKIRHAFSDNQRGSSQRGMRSGRVDTRALGLKAWDNDPRIFKRDRLPGRKDWFVVVAMDISGSTLGANIALEKRAVMGQCEMLARAGIPFELFAHTGDSSFGGIGRGYDVDMYHIKDAKEPWNNDTRQRLQAISSCSINLDGHALEFLRKRADSHRATNKVILYYSDGKMPASNHDEELEILQREIGICAKNKYVLLGVGIRTDSPKAHGLDTVEVWSDEDLSKVVEHLGRRISAVTNR